MTDALRQLATHLWAIAIALAWLWAMAGVGTAALGRWLPAPADAGASSDAGASRDAVPGPLHRLLLGLAVGAGILGTVFLALGAVGLLRPWAVLASAAAAALVAWRGVVGVPRTAAGAARELAADLRDAGVLALPWALAAGVVALGLVMALAPVTDWDSLMYHLPVPAAWLESGWVHVPPDNLHASRTGLFQILYAVPLALGEHRAAALLSLAFAAATAGAVHVVIRDRFGTREALLAGATTWAAAAVWFVAVTPRTDVALVLFLLLAHDALLRGIDSGARRWLVLAGALLGLAVATKFQAVPYILALLPLAWLDARADRGGWPGTAGRIGWVALAALVVAAPWLVRNIVLLGAPFYPLLAEPVPQPWIAALAPAGGVPALPEIMGQVVWRLTEPFNLYDFFLRPGRLSIEAEAAAYRPNFMLLALPLLLLVRDRRRELLALAVPALLYLAILLLGFPRANLRYMLPGVVPLAALGAVALVRVTARFRRGDIVLAALGIAALLPAALAATSATTRAGAHRHFAGELGPGTYLARHFEYGPLHGVMRQVNGLQPDARVLMLFDARGFHAPRTVLQDNKLSNWAYLDGLRRAGAIGDCLQGSGATHVLINRGALDFYLRSGALDLDALRVPALRDLVERCGTPVWERAGMSLLELAP